MAAPAPPPAAAAAVPAAPAPPAPVTGPLAATLQAVDDLPPPDLSLPALEPVSNRDTYRARPDDELEEATWFSSDEPDTLVPPTHIRLRSIHSKQATVITFANKSPFRVRALWLDFDGHEVVYSVLEPSTTRRYHTYATHPWIVRELRSGTRMLLSGRPAVVGLTSDVAVDIAAPPKLAWSLATHTCFPEPFTAAVRGLLLAHKALEPLAGTTSTSTTSTATTTAITPAAPAPLVLSDQAPGSPDNSDAEATASSPHGTLVQLGCAPALLSSPVAKAPRLCMPLPPLPTTPRTPRVPGLAAAAVVGSPAGPASSSSSLTTISISTSQATHVTATLTVSSPTSAVLTQTLDVQVLNSSSTADDMDCCASAADDTAAGAAAGGPARTAGRKAQRANRGIRKLCSSVKKVFCPSSAGKRASSPTAGEAQRAPLAAACAPTTTTTTHITLHLQSLLEDDGSCSGMQIDSVGPEDQAWPPVAQGTHLGDLPNHLLSRIAELAAPETWQGLQALPKGRPDIAPVLLACPPMTKEEAAAADAQAADGNDDAPPPLI